MFIRSAALIGSVPYLIILNCRDIITPIDLSLEPEPGHSEHPVTTTRRMGPMQIPKLLFAVPLIVASLTLSASATPGNGNGHAWGRSS